MVLGINNQTRLILGINQCDKTDELTSKAISLNDNFLNHKHRLHSSCIYITIGIQIFLFLYIVLCFFIYLHEIPCIKS